MAEPMLELVGVTAGYGRSMVLFDVDLAVPMGAAAAALGHNGAGKTTLLRVAVGLIPVKSGIVLLDGEDVTRMRPNRRVRKGLGIEEVIVGLTARGDLTMLLVEQHVGFALRSTDRYFTLESGRITSTGEGGEARSTRSAMRWRSDFDATHTPSAGATVSRRLGRRCRHRGTCLHSCQSNPNCEREERRTSLELKVVAVSGRGPPTN